ncbi:copper amine oxidase N-terminal domain-containing protein [Paenibacillus sp. D2_2]|uniref:copper amine oxidase N-terminal domain-containing protein n=1 Tax=Paenibacillus sp. D2_2 TaxID=3073092 RepID=UPI002814EDCA|nr:copper amine oxidase N-terminal domain-containing protein [Paenibacillus sp. D2_2]WMT42066.1 copper amine oxidase N-terminal domain-containing protein [Paenibacillus sp. D2_2]
MKKLTVLASLFIASLMIANVALAAGKPVELMMDGEKYLYVKGMKGAIPYQENGVTMVPIRFVTDKLGAKVGWNNASKSLQIQKDEIDLTLTIGSSTALVTGNTINLPAKVLQKDGTVMVPLQIVSEVLKEEVEWDEERNTVIIKTPGKEIGEVDPYGRKIRTTNLPKNYKDYPYILADIPNSMYEMKYPYSHKTDSMVSSKLYQLPEFTQENIDIWMSHIKEYGNLLLNLDYRTIDDKWIEDMGSHMIIYASELKKSAAYKYLDHYKDWAKKNKIQIEGTLTPEPSMIYKDGFGSYYVRSTVKFKFNYFKESKYLIFDTSKGAYQDGFNFKKDVWYSGYVDFPITTNVGGYWGPTLKVSVNASILNKSQITKE